MSTPAIMDRSFFAHNLWRWKCDLPELDPLKVHSFTLEQAQDNWFPEAIKLMRHRMLMGIYRHGYFRSPDQPNYDRIGSALTRLKLYQETGNGEHLIDVMNLCGIEFVKRAHPHFHFAPADDGVHTPVKESP